MKKELPTYVVVAIFAGTILALVSVRYRTSPIVVENPPAISCPTAGVNGSNPTESGSLKRSGRGFPLQYIEVETCYGDPSYSMNLLFLLLDMGFYVGLVIVFKHFISFVESKRSSNLSKQEGRL